nr:unnamed protein product [Digitaria exilis]
MALRQGEVSGLRRHLSPKQGERLIA